MISGDEFISVGKVVFFCFLFVISYILQAIYESETHDSIGKRKELMEMKEKKITND